MQNSVQLLRVQRWLISRHQASVDIQRPESEDVTRPAPRVYSDEIKLEHKHKIMLQVENSIWHAFDYLAVETGRTCASKSKLKVIRNG